MERLYPPIDEWDEEELARGRPRNRAGTFSGPPPSWISAKVHEEAIKRFKDMSQADMRGIVPAAIARIKWIITEDGVDNDGKRIVPVSTAMEASKWVVEHLLGKPTQRIEADISVRLQGILAAAVIDGQGQIQGSSGIIEAGSQFRDEDDEDDQGG